MARFEAHMTFAKEHARAVELLGREYNWVYSVITGCPILGQDTYCCLTTFGVKPAPLVDAMDRMASTLAAAGVPTLRRKVERIIYDTKTGVDEVALAFHDLPAGPRVVTGYE